MTKLEYPMNDDTLTEAIKIFNSKQICQGGPRVIDFPGKILITRSNKICVYFYYFCFQIINYNYILLRSKCETS